MNIIPMTLGQLIIKLSINILAKTYFHLQNAADGKSAGTTFFI